MMKTTNGALLGRAMTKGLCYLLLAACWLVFCSQAQASLSHPAVVSENPADTTPHIVLDGGSQKMMAFEQVGRTIYAGGLFDEVLDPAMTTTYSRQNFVAFDSETGVISTLNLSFDGIVTGIEASEDETALFISGAFSQVNGITRRGIAKYDLVNDRIDPTFAPTGMRTVSDIKLANGALIAAGNFSKHLMAHGSDDRRRPRHHRHYGRRRARHDRRDQGHENRGLPRRHAVGGHGQLHHRQRPVPETGLHAEPRLGARRSAPGTPPASTCTAVRSAGSSVRKAWTFLPTAAIS